LYALRDVTATVDNVSLIAASIMSKKIAAGADAVVLDVKVGDGAFMRTLPDAQALAETMYDLGGRAGREVVCLLTDMDQPLGRAVGNALEIREAVATLHGDGPEDLLELALAASAHLVALSDLGVSPTAARARAEAALADGAAAATYGRWIRAQGGDPSVDALPSAPVVRDVPAPAAGFVTAVGAVAVGRAAVRLGAGRTAKDEAIDHAVGIVCHRKRGDAVAAGDVLAEVHARDETSADAAVVDVRAAYEIGTDRPRPQPVVLDTIG
jgi:pyrimidine-nucleoside phosphorylase